MEVTESLKSLLDQPSKATVPTKRKPESHCVTEGVADDDIGDVEYATDPLSFEDFCFGKDFLPVKMHKLHMKHVPASVALLQAKQPGQPHHNLSQPCGRFMKNHHVGTSEDGLHSRDDELLLVSCFCSVLVFTVGRRSRKNWTFVCRF